MAKRGKGGGFWGAVKAVQTLKATWSRSETLPDAAKLWEHVRASKVASDEVVSSD